MCVCVRVCVCSFGSNLREFLLLEYASGLFTHHRYGYLKFNVTIIFMEILLDLHNVGKLVFSVLNGLSTNTNQLSAVIGCICVFCMKFVAVGC